MARWLAGCLAHWLACSLASVPKKWPAAWLLYKKNPCPSLCVAGRSVGLAGFSMMFWIVWFQFFYFEYIVDCHEAMR